MTGGGNEGRRGGDRRMNRSNRKRKIGNRKRRRTRDTGKGRKRKKTKNKREKKKNSIRTPRTQYQLQNTTRWRPKPRWQRLVKAIS